MLKLRHSGLRSVLALALVLALVLSAMPTGSFRVFAEEEEPTTETVLPEETQDDQNEADPELAEGLTEPLVEEPSEPGSETESGEETLPVETPSDVEPIVDLELVEGEKDDGMNPVNSDSLINAAAEQVELFEAEKNTSVTDESLQEVLDLLEDMTEEDLLEEAVSYPAIDFSQKVGGMLVEISAPEGAFPEGTTVEIRTVKDKDMLDMVKDVVEESVQSAEDVLASQVVEMQALDITFYNAKGVEIEPLLPISVSMTPAADKAPAIADVAIVHVDDAGEGTLMEELKYSDEAVSFETDAFSIYVFASVITTRFLDSHGNSWDVKVTYDSYAQIPDGAELVVREILPGTVEYKEALTALSGKKASEDHVSGYPVSVPLDLSDGNADSYALFLDISLIYEGIEIEPQTPVTVTVELGELPGNLSAEDVAKDLEIKHLKDTVEGMKSEDVIPERSFAANGDTIVTEFKVDAFSPYLMLYKFDSNGESYYRSTTIHYGYLQNGEFTEFPEGWCVNSAGYGPEMFSSEEWAGKNGLWKQLSNNTFIPAIFDFRNENTIYTYINAYASITMRAKNVEESEPGYTDLTIHNVPVAPGFYRIDNDANNPRLHLSAAVNETAASGTAVFHLSDVPDYNSSIHTLTSDVEKWVYVGDPTNRENTPIYNGSSYNTFSFATDLYIVYEAVPPVAAVGHSTYVVSDYTQLPEPDVKKSVVYNSDGTGTLSLSITGQEQRAEGHDLIDVLVVVDISGSMTLKPSGSSKTRYQIARDALKDLVNTLMDQNTEGDANPAVRMGIMTFGKEVTMYPFSGETFTSDKNAFLNVLTNANGNGIPEPHTGVVTNWEGALREASSLGGWRSDADCYTIFITDGNPTVRLSRGDYYQPKNKNTYSGSNIVAKYTDTELDVVGTPYYAVGGYYSHGEEINATYHLTTSGGYDARHIERNVNACQDEAELMGAAGMKFYGLYIFGGNWSSNYAQYSSAYDRLKQITKWVTGDDAVAGQQTFDVQTPQDMKEAFATIARNMTGYVGFTNVVINDEVTELTELDGKKEDTTTEFTYTKTWTDDSGTHTETFTPNPTVNHINPAVYNTETKSISWEMGENFALEDGVTYTVTCIVWPDQDAYDYVAKYKNRELSKDELRALGVVYDDLSDTYTVETNGPDLHAAYTRSTVRGDLQVPKQIYRPDDPNSVLALYGEGVTVIDDNGNTVAPKNSASIPTAPDEDLVVLPMDMVVQKTWKNSLDPAATTYVIQLLEDGTIIKTFTINVSETNASEGSWTSSADDAENVACGLIRIDKNGVARVYETGHVYTLAENDYHWAFDPGIYRMMAIGKEAIAATPASYVPTILRKVENADDIPSAMKNDTSRVYYKSGSDEYYRVEGDVFKVAASGENTLTLTASNERRSNLNLMKRVVDPSGTTIKDISKDYKDQEFVFSITVNDPEDALVWFSVQTDPDDPSTVVTNLTTSALPEEDETTHEPLNNGYFYVASGQTFTVTLKPTWNLRFTNIPTGSTYTIVEQGLPEGSTLAFYQAECDQADEGMFTVTVDENTISGTVTKNDTSYEIYAQNYEPKISVTVEKDWADDGDKDGARPGSIEVQLKADGVALGTPETLNAGNKWTYTWSGLSKIVNSEDGEHDIVYTVEEKSVELYDAPAYAPASVSGADGTITITNVHKPEMVSISGTKTWDDADNQDGLRPESITINLLADGKEIKEVKVTPAEDGSWSYSFTNLPKYTSGAAINYTITEDGITGYTPEVTGYNVKNIHKPVTIDIPVQKIWSDNNNQDHRRPSSITVNLLANGKKVQETTLTERGEWKYTFTGLPKKAGGEDITYTITENAIKYYSTEIKDFTITNSYTPTSVDVKGVKTWNDADDQDRLRPQSITIHLLADGQTIQTKTVTEAEDGAWRYEFTGLPRYDGDDEISYSIAEDPVDGYETIVSGYNVTNTHKPAVISISGTKTWDDQNNKDGSRPANITVNLLANGDPVRSVTVAPGEDGSWTYEFKDVPKYADGEEIVYTATEAAVPGYEPTINGFDITNSHTPVTPADPPRPPKPPVEPDPDPDPVDPPVDPNPVDPDPDPIDEAEEIEGDDVPLSGYEVEPEEDEEIDEEATPLSPFTGDDRHTNAWAGVSLASLVGITLLARRRKEEE